MKKITLLLSLSIMLLLYSCGDASTFSAEGTVKDLGTQNMRVIYYSNGTQLLTVPVKDDKFEFKAQITQPTIVEFYTSGKMLLGRAFVSNGDDLECTFIKNSPQRAVIEGNDVSERWTKFLNENIETFARGNVKKINSLVAKYITSNKQDILSTLLLITEYINLENEDEAIKLLSTISPEARPQSIIESYEALLDRGNNVKAREKLSTTSYYSRDDSLSTYIPHKSSYSVIAFSNESSRQEEKLAENMRAFSNDYAKKRLQVVDISFDPDTALWKKSTATDSATWQQGWVLGGASAHSIERLGISRLPYYIVADSTGNQLYRGCSIDSVKNKIKRLLK